MEISLSQIPEEGLTLIGENPASILGLEDDRFIEANQSVTHDFFAQLLPNELVVRGRLEAKLQLACARCSEFFSTTVIDSSFLRAYDITAEVDRIELTDDIRDAILLRIPHFPLCSTACKGLCTQCGSNLNDGPCDCSPPREESRWDALDPLTL